MREYKTKFQDEEKRVEILEGGKTVRLGENAFTIHDMNGILVLSDASGKQYRIDDVVKLPDGKLRVHINGFSVDLSVEDPLDISSAEEEVTGEVHSPMAGVVTKILVKEGDKIKKGDHLLLLSAMKMENEIVAPINGIVRRVVCEANQQVNASDLLVVIEPPE